MMERRRPTPIEVLQQLVTGRPWADGRFRLVTYSQRMPNFSMVLNNPGSAVATTPARSDRFVALTGMPVFTSSAPVVERFARHASEHPTAIAINTASGFTTYADLMERAANIAKLLQASTCAADEIVAVCLPRGVDLIATLFAILHSGAAFVALDPSYPADRLRTTVSVTQSTRVVCNAATESVARQLHGLTTISIDTIANNNESRTFATDTNVDGSGLAYVITTSGSSGQPKCVAITHESISNLVAWASASFHPHALSNTLWSTSIGFDLAIFEIFVPLCTGGRVTVVDTLFDLAWATHANDVTLVNTVPSKLTEFLRDGALPRSVTTVCCAGEPLSQDLADVCYERGVANVFNLYGPSETTTYSTAAHISYKAPFAPPIGLPIANTSIALLDASGDPIRSNGWGEIAIGGIGVARGYLGASAHPADRFFVHDGSRWYRTGDLGSIGADGQLRYHGRVDDQVKIRGTRIEPGDVEAALRTHPEIIDAVVVSIERHDATELGALIVASRELTPTVVREYLALRLPQPMIPSVISFGPCLPRLSNGKVDRNQTRGTLARTVEPTSERAATGHASRLEHDVASCWQAVLQLDELPTTMDDFFELGGHSLRAVRLVAHTEARFGVRIPVELLVTHSTLAAYTELIRDAAALTAANVSTRLTQFCIGRNRDAAPLVVVVAWPGDVFAARRLSVVSDGERDVYGLALSSLSTGATTPRTVGAIAAEVMPALTNLRSRHQHVHLAGHSFGGLVAAEVARRLDRHPMGVTALSLALFDTQAPPVQRLRRLVRRTVGAWRSRHPQPRGTQAFDRYLVALNDHYESATLRHRPRPIALPTIVLESVPQSSDPTTSVSTALGWSNLVHNSLQVVTRYGRHGSIFNDHQFVIMVEDYMRFLTKFELPNQQQQQFSKGEQ